MNKTEEESENLHRRFLEREIDLGAFVQKYKKLRTTYHRRALVHLAAKTSSTGWIDTDTLLYTRVFGEHNFSIVSLYGIGVILIYLYAFLLYINYVNSYHIRPNTAVNGNFIICLKNSSVRSRRYMKKKKKLW